MKQNLNLKKVGFGGFFHFLDLKNMVFTHAEDFCAAYCPNL
jgi:hypothetical protein